MAEFVNAAAQVVPVSGSVLFPASGCRCRAPSDIRHRAGSGLFNLSGPGRYVVHFGGNVAVPAGVTVGPVSVGIAVDGEVLPGVVATSTPAAVGDLNNVSLMTSVDVPCGCCAAVSVRNAGTAPVEVSAANLMITRVA